jgi:uncharacterized membrane protein YdbT with pleckstrin-like domain
MQGDIIIPAHKRQNPSQPIVQTTSRQREEYDSDKDDTEEYEYTIFVIRPSIRAFIPKMISAFIFSLIVIAVAVIINQYLYDILSQYLPALSTDVITALAVFVVLCIALITTLSIIVSLWSTEYTLTSQRLFLKEGLISQHIEEVELFRIKDVKSYQGIVQRILGIGEVIIFSTDDSTPELLLFGIKGPVDIKEQVRKAYRHARKKERVKTAEFIQS